MFDIKGKRNALDEFISVLDVLERADKALFAVALLKFFDSKTIGKDYDEE